MAASLETLATPPIGFASAWPKTIFGPMVGGGASPAVAILLWAVKGEVVVGTAPETNLPSFVLLLLLLPGFASFLLPLRLLLLRPPLLLGRGRCVTFRLVL